MNDDCDFADLYDEEILEPDIDGRGVGLYDFVAYMQMPVFIFMPDGSMWPAVNVNARVPPVQLFNPDGSPKLDANGDPVFVGASKWLRHNRPVEAMTWIPGLPQLIPHRLASEGGWIERQDTTTFNLYKPPRIKLGDARKAGPWINHVRKVFPPDADHIMDWLGHRVQFPGEKTNHGLVLGGAPETGKDTLLEPVKYAVGPWNFQEVTPSQMMGRFNGFVKSVILRISEGRDLGTELDRFSFYEHLKIFAASPPDTLRCDEKNRREYYVFNVLGLILTTNHKTDGIYLPADDRRTHVAWTTLTKNDFEPEYFPRLWNYYEDGGIAHVAAYLAERDLSGFDPKAAPTKTPAFWDIVNAHRAPEDAELADVIDALGRPDAVTLTQLIAAAKGETSAWLVDRKNRRSIPHKLERAGYVSVQNPNRDDGLWIVQGKRSVIYAKSEITLADRFRAASRL